MVTNSIVFISFFLVKVKKKKKEKKISLFIHDLARHKMPTVMLALLRKNRN